MKCYLLLDFGSTYTKLTLIDIENEKIYATSSDYTTIESNVLEGYKKAYKKLEDSIDKENLEIKKVLACSSAAGGLKMIAIGITPEYTVEAAKMAALGAGARLLKAYKYMLSDEDIQEIKELKPDIILLSGGAEAGNTRYIIENAKKLTFLNDEIPIVVSGNSYAYKDIEKIFKDKNIGNYKITENLMPDVNMINPDPVREIIREIFMDRITKAKGMEDVESMAGKILMPTPTAVINAARLLSDGTKKYVGMGELLVVDVGGATTDIHSIGDGIDKKNNYFYEGIKEPYAKRTVEGDLGMRYSALSLYECIGSEKFNNYLNKDIDCLEHFNRRINDVKMIPENDFQKEFDCAMAKACVDVAIKRHAGKIRNSYMNGKTVTMQSGKDLRNTKFVIGTGGVIINNNSKEILKNRNLDNIENILLPQNPNYFLDKNYILSAMGLLATEDEDLAFKILKDNLVALN